MHKYLVVVLCFFVCIGNIANSYGREVKANYYLNINSRGSLYAIYINGIKIEDRMSESQTSISVPVNYAMSKGDNELKVIFSPVKGRDGGKYDFIIGPKPTFYMKLELERVSFDSGKRSKLTLLNASFDMSEGKVISKDELNGADVNYSSDFVEVSRSMEYKEGENLFNSYSKPFDAYSIQSSFYVEDWFPDFIWESGQNLVVDDNLKHEIREAYKKIYKTLDENNYDSFLNYMSDLWTFTAESLGLDGLDGYLNSISLNKNNIRVHSPGAELDEINLPESNEDLHVEIAGKGKLATVLPSPIKWVRSDGSGPVMKVAFYKDQSGEWRVGAVF